MSYFAFTATPKSKTLELFGTKQKDETFKPFSLYSMRQAIEEGFILDVLENYTTYKIYWKLLKKIEDDPRDDRKKANFLLKRFVDMHEHSVDKKTEIIVEHFNEHVRRLIKGKAKAMIVTRSRLHAVRYKIAVDQHLKNRGCDYKALVAFSGTVNDGGKDYTEMNMNGFPENQTAETFNQDEYRFMIVAEKYQTGFDQPLLHTMYVDKKLKGLHAVQTLSRLNRIQPDKEGTMVLDFANETDAIQKAFQPYYDRITLSEPTDPNQLYDLESKLDGFYFYEKEDIARFVEIYFYKNSTQDQLFTLLDPVVETFKEADEESQTNFRGTLNDYIRLYTFLSQIITFIDIDLEKLYIFGRILARLLPVSEDNLLVEITRKIDLGSFRTQKTYEGKVSLSRGIIEVPPQSVAESHEESEEELEPLSKIIQDLNERFGTDFSDDDKSFIEQLEIQLAYHPTLENSLLVNSPDNFRLTFNNTVNDIIQDMIDTNFKFFRTD